MTTGSGRGYSNMQQINIYINSQMWQEKPEPTNKQPETKTSDTTNRIQKNCKIM